MYVRICKIKGGISSEFYFYHADVWFHEKCQHYLQFCFTEWWIPKGQVTERVSITNNVCSDTEDLISLYFLDQAWRSPYSTKYLLLIWMLCERSKYSSFVFPSLHFGTFLKSTQFTFDFSRYHYLIPANQIISISGSYVEQVRWQPCKEYRLLEGIILKNSPSWWNSHALTYIHNGVCAHNFSGLLCSYVERKHLIQ